MRHPVNPLRVQLVSMMLEEAPVAAESIAPVTFSEPKQSSRFDANYNNLDATQTEQPEAAKPPPARHTANYSRFARVDVSKAAPESVEVAEPKKSEEPPEPVQVPTINFVAEQWNTEHYANAQFLRPLETTTKHSALVMTNTFNVLNKSNNVADVQRQCQIHEEETNMSTDNLYRHPLANTVNNSLVNFINSSLGLPQPEDTLTEAERRNNQKAAIEKRKAIKIKILINADPTLKKEHRDAHTMLVSCAPLETLKAAQITVKTIAEIGVTFSLWLSWGYEIRHLIFLGANWQDLLILGLSHYHIQKYRSKAGPAVLAAPPLNVTFKTLYTELGISVDDAVNSLKFTTADFAVLGEDLDSLIDQGFNHEHVKTMGEPASNYVLAFKANPKQLRTLGLTATGTTAAVHRPLAPKEHIVRRHSSSIAY